jgi:hypothetical protein
LPVIFQPDVVIRHCHAALRPGGTMLVTVPCFCRYSPHPVDYWRFTASSLARLLSENTDCADPEVASYGNLVASVGFLQGLAASELLPDELDFQDERFPIVATAVIRKSPGL